MKQLLLAFAVILALPFSSCQSCGGEEFSDISGRWVNDTFGPQKLASLEVDEAGTEKEVESDLDIVLKIKAGLPEETFDEQQISGTVTVCDPDYGFSGVYEIDAENSIYDPAGSCGGNDGFGRVDIIARSGELTFEIDGAFICTGHADELTEAGVSLYRGAKDNPVLHIILLKTDPDAKGTDSQITLLHNDGASCDSTVGPAADDDATTDDDDTAD